MGQLNPRLTVSGGGRRKPSRLVHFFGRAQGILGLRSLLRANVETAERRMLDGNRDGSPLVIELLNQVPFLATGI